MFCKLSLVLTFLISIASCKKSFTIIIDTTQSMQGEIDVLKRNLGFVFNQLGNSSNVDNFILVTFNDPDVDPPTYFSSSDELLASLDTLTGKGGQDCPENSLAAIQKALEVSDSESYVFLFTDAYAKDDSKYTAIDNLCRGTRSQVFIFLTGKCYESATSSQGNVDIFFDIAKSCSGTFFKFVSPIDLRQALLFMHEIVKVEWNNVETYETFTDHKQFTLSVNAITGDVMVAANGDHPEVQFVDKYGQNVTFEEIINTGHSVVVRLINPETGEYIAHVRGHGPVSTTVYRKNKLPFRFGFSTKRPISLEETAPRPIAGRTNYILLAMSDSSIQINSVKLYKVEANESQTLTLEEIGDRKGIYVASCFFEPEKSFSIFVSGRDSSKYQDFSASTKVLNPQPTVSETHWTKPSMEILERGTTDLEFGKNTTLVCKVTGYPKPSIWWEDGDGKNLTSEDQLLVIPNIHISYAVIDNVNKNLTIYCKAKNAEGEDSQSKDLYVSRPFTFEVIQTPKDETFEFGTEGKLYCEAQAYPTSITKWYHNDTLIDYFDNYQIVAEENMLLIKNMSLTDTGEYKCELFNEVETKTYTAEVGISGLEAPRIVVQKSELTLTPGDWTDEIECKIIGGKPTPEITWKYKPNDANEFDTVPDGVYIRETKLKIPAVKIEHNGVFRCEANNIIGQDYRDVNIKVQYAPKINDNQPRTVTVREGDPVELTCDVNAVPAARIRWEISQGDVLVAFDKRHTTDEYFTHRFEALWKDSGNYHCIAENDVGRAEKTVTVNVLVAPYIQAPKSNIVIVRAGTAVIFPCNILYGNPAPSSRWEFTSGSTVVVISRSKSADHLLNLGNVNRSHEGTYICLAENEVGSDNIKIYLQVQ